MGAKVLHNIAFFAAGLLAAAAFIGLYWHSNKDELSQKVLSKVAAGNYCPTDPDTNLNASDANQDQAEDRIYFVGCGGFF